MKKSSALLLILVILISCKSPKKDKENTNENVTAVLSFIKSQVAQLDTSLSPIKKIEQVDTLPADTIDISRNEIRALANDFLNIPDISQKQYKDEYKESQNYDPDLGLVSLLTLPKTTSSADIQKQEVLIKPDSEGGKIVTMYIDREWGNKDSSVTKKMIWQVDGYFQVLTLKQFPGQPETSHLLKVTWKDLTKSE